MNKRTTLLHALIGCEFEAKELNTPDALKAMIYTAYWVGRDQEMEHGEVIDKIRDAAVDFRWRGGEDRRDADG